MWLLLPIGALAGAPPPASTAEGLIREAKLLETGGFPLAAGLVAAEALAPAEPDPELKAEVLTTLGRLAEATGDWGITAAAVKGAALDDATPDWLRYRVGLARFAEDPAGARVALDTVPDDSPYAARARYLAGVADMRTERPAGAVRHFGHALKISRAHDLRGAPDVAGAALRGISVVYFSVAQYDQALEYALKVPADSSTFAENLVSLAWTEFYLSHPLPESVATARKLRQDGAWLPEAGIVESLNAFNHRRYTEAAEVARATTVEVVAAEEAVTLASAGGGDGYTEHVLGERSPLPAGIVTRLRRDRDLRDLESVVGEAASELARLGRAGQRIARHKRRLLIEFDRARADAAERLSFLLRREATHLDVVHHELDILSYEIADAALVVGAIGDTERRAARERLATEFLPNARGDETFELNFRLADDIRNAPGEDPAAFAERTAALLSATTGAEPRLPEAWAQLWMAQTAAGDSARAATSLAMILTRADQTEPRVALQLSNLLVALGDYASASRLCLALLDNRAREWASLPGLLRPTQAQELEARYLLGWSQWGAGDHAGAIATLHRVSPNPLLRDDQELRSYALEAAAWADLQKLEPALARESAAPR